MSNPPELLAGRLVRLQAENIQNLVAIDITLPSEDGAVCVGGKNGAGKSSLLNCIAIALGGADEMPTDPIRIGEESAKILLEFEGITVKLKLTLQDDKTVNRYLVIEAKDGTKYASPQKLLDALTGKLAFDPLEFSGKPPREQLTMLHKFLGIDFGPLLAERRKYFDERTVQKRLLDAAATKFAAQLTYADAPSAPVDVATINSELETALAKNRDYDAAIRNAEKTSAALASQRATIEKIRQSLIAEETKLSPLLVADTEAAKVRNAAAKIDTAPIMVRLQTVQQTNAKVAANAAARTLELERDTARAVVLKLTGQIEAIDAQKQATLAAAEYPLDGMSVSDDEVLYEGVRFSQLNDATKIAVSCAMGLSLNPKLKLMIIRQGCHLDDDMLQVVRDMAKQANALILIERVGLGQECKIIIADGNVKEIRP